MLTEGMNSLFLTLDEPMGVDVLLLVCPCDALLAAAAAVFHVVRVQADLIYILDSTFLLHYFEFASYSKSMLNFP